MDSETFSPQLKQILEALLFASQKPVSAKEFSTFLRGAAEAAKEDPAVAPFARVKEDALRAAIDELVSDYASTGRAFEVRETVAGWQLVSSSAYAPWLRQLFPENRPARLSAPGMETLAIIAYRQPITRADIEAVRGVAVDGVMQTLLERGLVKIAGRAEVPGRPLLYETTHHFMEHFGLRSLEELPNSAELRRIALPTATPPLESPAEAAVPELPLAGGESAEAGPIPPAEAAVEEGAVAGGVPQEPGETVS